MTRTSVTEEELIDILNKTFDKRDEYGDYKDCKIDVITTKRAKPDSDGCNWFGYTMRDCRIEDKEFQISVRNVVREVRRKYNLK